MKAETLLRSLQEIDEGLLAASETPIPEKTHRPLAWIAAAAALIVIAGLGWLGWQHIFANRGTDGPGQVAASPSGSTELVPEIDESTGPSGKGVLPDQMDPPEDLPTEPTEGPPDGPVERALPVIEAGDSFHEAALADSLEVLDHQQAPLWTPTTEFQTLPVFEARDLTHDATTPILGDETMQQILREEAEKAGLGEIEIYPAAYSLPADWDGDLSVLASYTGVSDKGQISIWSYGWITIVFGQPMKDWLDAQPEGVRENIQNDPQYAKLVYVEMYRTLLELPYLEAWELEAESTQASVNPRYASGRTSDDGKELYLADMLRDVDMVLNADGSLHSLSYGACFRECYLPLGDYPVISLEEAETLAKNNQYFTDGLLWEGYEFDWDPANGLYHPELIYNQITPNKLRLPYYRFYVEVTCTPVDFTLAGEDAQEHTVYMPIYVPAIESRYLSDFPLEA